MEIKIDQILGKMPDRDFFKPVKRLSYLPYDMDIALSVVEKIGKNLNEKFVIDQENRLAYESLIRWVHGDHEMKSVCPQTGHIMPGNINKGIYIGGSTGTGKSWALEIMSAYSTIDDVRFISGDKFKRLEWKNIRCDAICDQYASNGDISKFKNADIIGIQDFGAEQKETLYMGNRIDVLGQILEYRGDCRDKITLMTSNYKWESEKNILRERYGHRLISRFYEMFNYLEIKGKDRRLI